MKLRTLGLLLALTVPGLNSFAQYSWDWHDPLDLNYFDFGDNKLLLYNGIGLGLSIRLSQLTPQEKKLFRGVNFSSYVDVIYEYNRPPKSDVLIGRFRWDKRIRKVLSIGGDMSMYKVSDTEISTVGVGTQLVFLWHIVDRENWKLQFDNGVGPNYFVDAFPFGGTKFNFTTFYGLSLAIKLPSIAWIVVGIKNIHISNADIKGRERNPALDGVGLSVGYRFF